MWDPLELGGIDLNLLPKLRALYRRRNVSEAARELHLTQSALSNALARMRSLFDDELFVRTPTGMEPTPLAHALAEPVERALATLELELRQIKGFVPERSARTFRIAMTQLAEALLAPNLLGMAQATAPDIVISTVVPGDRDFVTGLGARTYDFAVGHFAELGAGFRSLDLGAAELVVIVRAGHLVLDGPLTRESLSDCIFADVVEAGTGWSEISRTLVRGSRTRVLRFRTANVLSLPWVVSATDLVAVVPLWFALRYAAAAGLRVLKMPGGPKGPHLRLVWHENFEHDPGHAWMRSLIMRAGAKARNQEASESMPLIVVKGDVDDPDDLAAP